MVEGIAGSTLSTTRGLVTGVKSMSPEYAAVREWSPMDSDVVVHVADPEVSSVREVSSVVPSKSSTVPVGVPAPVDSTVRFTTTVYPTRTGPGAAVTVATGLAWMTDTSTGADVLELKSTSAVSP